MIFIGEYKKSEDLGKVTRGVGMLDVDAVFIPTIIGPDDTHVDEKVIDTIIKEEARIILDYVLLYGKHPKRHCLIVMPTKIAGVLNSSLLTSLLCQPGSVVLFESGSANITNDESYASVRMLRVIGDAIVDMANSI